MPTPTQFTIRQLTKEFAVTSRTLRFYEDEGFYKTTRINAQTRIYSAETHDTIATILKFRRFGFSLPEIRQHLAITGDVARKVDAKRMMVDRIHALEAQKVAADAMIASLEQSIFEVEQALAPERAVA